MKLPRLLSLAVLAALAAPVGAAEDPALVHARRLLEKAPIIDGHNDLPWVIRENAKAPMDVGAYDLRTKTTGHTDLQRLREGGVGGQFWSVYIPAEVPGGFARTQLEQIDIARRVIARYPDALEAAGTAAEVKRAMKHKHVASLLGVEGGHAIENSLGALRAYYDLGVRYMTLTHTSPWTGPMPRATPHATRGSRSSARKSSAR